VSGPGGIVGADAEEEAHPPNRQEAGPLRCGGDCRRLPWGATGRRPVPEHDPPTGRLVRPVRHPADPTEEHEEHEGGSEADGRR